jgi:hypothetical protein
MKFCNNNYDKIAEPGGSLDVENVCGDDATNFLAAQVTLIVSVSITR